MKGKLTHLHVRFSHLMFPITAIFLLFHHPIPCALPFLLYLVDIFVATICYMNLH